MRALFDIRYRQLWAPDTDGAAPAWSLASGLSGDGNELRVPFGFGETVEMEWRAVGPDGTVSNWTRLPPQLVDTRGAVLFCLPRVLWIDCTQVLRWKYDEEPPALAGWLVRTAEGNYPWFGFARPCHDGILRCPWLVLHGIPKGPRTFFVAPVDFLGNVGDPLRVVAESGPYDDHEDAIVTLEQHGPSNDPGDYPGTIVEGVHNAGAQAILGDAIPTFYSGDSRPVYAGSPDAAMYGGHRGDVVYDHQFIPEPDEDLLASVLTLLPVVAPDRGWWAEVRNGTRPFYDGRPNGHVYSDDPNGRLYEEAPFGEWVYHGGAGTLHGVYTGIPTARFYKSAERRPWPGRLSALSRMPYEVRITVPGSRLDDDRATLSSIRFTVSKPEEFLNAAEVDAAIAAAVAGGVTPSAHATTHKHGGGDEVATESPGANAIPKAGADAMLDREWVDLFSPDLFQVWDDFIIVQGGNNDHFIGDNSGTNSSSGQAGPQNGGEVGVVSCNTGTTTTGRASRRSDLDGIILGLGAIVFEARVRVETLADTATQDYNALVGLADIVTAIPPADGVYFLYDRDVDANWHAVTRAGGLETNTDTGVAVSTSWQKLRIEINDGATEVKFYIDGALEATHSSEITGATLGAVVNIIKELGSTARTLLADWMAFSKKFVTPR